MVLYEELLDALAKEAKEAPGWVSLVIACNYIPLFLLLPRLDMVLKSLGIEIEKEHATVATLVALTLFLVGDGLDTIIFPRENSGNRSEKLLHSFLFIMAVWGLFLTVLREWSAAVFWVIFVIPLFTYRRKQEQLERPRKPTTGFNGLVQPPALWKHLERVRDDARVNLHLKSGMYPVSKELCRAAAKYGDRMPRWIGISLLNEAAKFIRSAVIPLTVWAAWLPFHGQPSRSAVLLVAAIAALLLYSALKAYHMCLMYELAVGLTGYKADDLPEGLRVFLWNTDTKDPLKYALVASGHPRKPTASPA